MVEFMPEYMPIDEFDAYTGHDDWHALYSIQLGELVEAGIFDWAKPELDWSIAAYDDEQYARVCAYFIDRFYYDEISILPVGQWFKQLHRRLIYELMPKYKPLYERIAEGIDPFQNGGEYHKRREISSDYPETLLSENADYISTGNDLEYETVKEGDIPNALDAYMQLYRSVDKALLDELELLFVQLYTSNVNGL